MLKRFASYYKPHRRLFYIDMFCALIISACNMFYPIIAKDIINVYVPERDMRRLVLWCCVLLGIYLLKAGMTLHSGLLGPYRRRADTGRYAPGDVRPP